LVEDLNLLADCIAGSNADLFGQGDCIFWIAAGKRVPVNPNVLWEISTKYVVTKHPRETTNGWDVEFRPHEPDEMTLRALLTAKTPEEGGLIWRLPKGPSEPSKLSEQEQREVRMRLKTGERPERIAHAYGTDVGTIERLSG
jgi:hypothetical protein